MPKATKASKKAVAQKPMTKGEMIEAISTATGFTKTDVEAVYAALVDVVAQQAKTGVFTLHNIGKFSVVQRKERVGHNPRTKEAITIPAGPALKFAVSKYLKDQVLG